MKRVARFVYIVAALLTFGCPLLAQTRNQLEGKYSKLDAYLVRPNILLTARFASDGQVCEMVLEPRRAVGQKEVEKVVLNSTLSEEEALAIVEEIVPESARGQKDNSGLSKVWAVSGRSMSRVQRYENMTVSLSGSFDGEHGGFMAAVVRFPSRSCT